jgi:hypothetical protein
MLSIILIDKPFTSVSSYFLYTNHLIITQSQEVKHNSNYSEENLINES